MRKVLAHALGMLVRNAGPILLAMLGPVVAMTLAREIMLGPVDPLFVQFGGLVAFVVWYVLWIGFASVLHARFLDQRNSPPPWRTMIWSRAQMSFLFGIVRVTGLLIVVGYVFAIPVAVASQISPIVGEVAEWIMLLVAMVIWAGVALVFPAAAVGRPLALRDSWELTQPSRVRVVILVGPLYVFAWTFLPVALVLPFTPSIVSAPAWQLNLISAVLMFAGAAIVAAVLSATYRGLVEMRPADVRDTYIPQDDPPDIPQDNPPGADTR